MKYKTVLFKDVCRVIRGISYRSSNYTDQNDEHGEIFVNLKCVTPDGFNQNGIKYYKGIHKDDQFIFAGDLLIANTDLTRNREVIGNSIMIPNLNKKACFSMDLSKIEIIDESILDKDFLYYYLKSPIARHFMISHSDGSTVVHLLTKAVLKMNMTIPDLEIQRKIVRILSTLDEKIELNNKQNIMLEKIIFVLYNYFIKYLNESNSKHLNLGNIANCRLGGTPSRNKPEYWNGDINWINSGSINSFRIIEPSELITDEGLNHSSTVLLPKGTTVLAITGATLGRVSRLEIESCANQSVIGIIGNEKISNEYIYLTILENIQELTNKQTGGAQQHINKNDVSEFDVLIPEQDLMTKFTKQVKPFFDKISINCFENKNLSRIRDLLIPKLISGEINLEKAEI